ncbi:hypothetical protein D3C75_700820 [compost metagenome]
MAVGYGNPDALGGDGRACGFHDSAVHDASPNTQGLLLALLFLAADIRNHVVDHFRPILEGFAGAGNGLIGGCHHGGRLEGCQCAQRRHIALDRAVGLYGNKAGFGAQTLALMFDNGDMARVDLGNHHGNVRRPAVGRVIGDDRCAGFGISLLQRFDFFLLHIHSTEDQIHLCGKFLHFGRILNRDLLHGLRHRLLQLPSALHRFLVHLARGAGAGCNSGYLKPGMVI